MARLFAFLRAVNAGRKRAVKMDVLHQAFESLGFFKVATFLSSGNVVFETKSKDVRALEKKIARKLQQTLGYHMPVFIRTNQEVEEIAAVDPFKDSRGQGADVNIILLADTVDAGSEAKLKTLETVTDGFLVRGREIYWWRRKKPGTSLYSTVPLSKALPRPFTIRSANTMRKLAAKWPQVSS